MSKAKRKQAERLTGLQTAFAEEYVKDFNGTRAARRAGYKGNDVTLASLAHTLLKMPKIRAHWRSLMRGRAMGAEEALARMSDWARGSIEPFVQIVVDDDDGECRVYEEREGDEDERPKLRFTVDLTSKRAQAHWHLVKKLSWTASGLPILELHDAKDATARLLALHGDIPIGALTNPDAGEPPPEQEMSVEEQEDRAIEVARILAQFDVGAAARAYDAEE